MSEKQVIVFLQNKYPELREYPSDALPPKSVVSELENGVWYVAFIQNGSGRLILGARCFTVTANRKISEKTAVLPDTVSAVSISPKTCSVMPSDTFNSSNTPYDSSVPSCVVEGCHGMDITCGVNAAKMCTEVYMLGDKCRSLAVCGVVDGVCRQIENNAFDSCVSCVRACLDKATNGSSGQFECESKCT